MRIQERKKADIWTRLIFITVSFFLVAFLWTSPAFADVGPKPSVAVTVENVQEGHAYYATLLGEGDLYGPYRAVTDAPSEEIYAAYYVNGTEAEEAFDVFYNYAETDDFYFWGQVFEVQEGSFGWGYYPPDTFKVLIYDYTSKELYVSPEGSRFAFESSYTVTLEEGGTCTLTEIADIGTTLKSFVLRVVITIVLEVLIALLFGYRSRRELTIITFVNIGTQILLNGILAILDYSSGALVWIILFPILELIIILIEAIIYAFALKSEKKGRGRGVAYAFVANLVSAVFGFAIGLLVR